MMALVALRRSLDELVEGVRAFVAMVPVAFTYAFRNVLARKASTAVTTLGVTVSVMVFVLMSATAAGIGQVAVSTGSPRNIMVLSEGATSAEVSFLDVPTLQRIRGLSGVARDRNGDAVASPELLSGRSLRRTSEASAPQTLVQMRGVTTKAFEVHEDVQVEGGRFPTSPGEVLVGSVLARQLGLDLGDEIWLGAQRAVVSGFLGASGQIFAGEVWLDFDDLRNQLGRRGASILVLRAEIEERVPELIEEITSTPGLLVTARSEKAHYEQIQQVTGPFVVLGNFISLILGFGAVLAGMNTLYAAMSRRTRELGTLRALGFGSWFVGGTLLLESLLVGVIGGLVGAGIALLFDGFAFNLLGLSFELTVEPETLVQGGGLALLVGLLGGALPARSALRLKIIEALRQA